MTAGYCSSLNFDSCRVDSCIIHVAVSLHLSHFHRFVHPLQTRGATPQGMHGERPESVHKSCYQCNYVGFDAQTHNHISISGPGGDQDDQWLDRSDEVRRYFWGNCPLDRFHEPQAGVKQLFRVSPRPCAKRRRFFPGFCRLVQIAGKVKVLPYGSRRVWGDVLKTKVCASKFYIIIVE